MGQREPKPRPKSSSYITREGDARLKAELTHLLYTERPKVTRGVAEAAAEGDRSENAEYIYGKKRLREIDKRIEHLTKRLEVLAVVLPEPRKDPARIYFGATVELEDEDGETRRYRVVGPDEARPEHGEVSMDSPLGKGLLGRRVGDEVTVVRPKGSVTYTVVDVQNDA